MSERILLRVSNHRAFIWDVDDIRTLRSKHRICGLLGGTLPHISQQNVFLGVPLILMPEEVVLLMEEGIAAIVDDIHAHHKPSKSEERGWLRLQRQEQQKEMARKSSISVISAQKSMSEEAVAKRRKREERRLQALSKISEENGENGDPSGSILTQTSRPSTPASVLSTSVSYTVKIPTSSTQLKWYKALHHCFDDIRAAREAEIWSYPSSSEERARCGVYRALWEKGYYMGCGIKFGGDYLVYPGDPLRYHSHFVASVLDSSSPLRPMEIIAHGRLGTATKKAHLLCSWDEKAQKADIYSIEWAGFG
ncbi:SEN34 [Sanghuangporus weigelae]